MNKSAAKKAPATDFENLVRNGIDFLEKAMSQLDSDPKHSVINFYTAVEIFLKAPLAHEHWTLVVVDRDFNRQNYESGDFLSVSFEDACTRLATALKKPLKASAKEAFDKVRKHRNRMVHFYHDGIDGKQRDEIKLEQAQAWFELNRFIVDTWRNKFEPFLFELRRMERNLIAHNHYAQAKYESLIPKIQGLKKSGTTFQVCPNCGTEGCQFEDERHRITSLDCLVCFLREKKIQIECPDCENADQSVVAYESFVCTNCEHEVSGESAILKWTQCMNFPSNQNTAAYFDLLKEFASQDSHDVAKGIVSQVVESKDDFRIMIEQEGDKAHRRFLPIPDIGKREQEVWLLPNYSSFTNIYARMNLLLKGKLEGTRIFHDEQAHFEEIIAVAKSQAERAKVSFDKFKPPHSDYNFKQISDLFFKASPESTGVQLADIVAGLCMRWYQAHLNDEHDTEVLDQATDVLLHHSNPHRGVGINIVGPHNMAEKLFGVGGY